MYGAFGRRQLKRLMIMSVVLQSGTVVGTRRTVIADDSLREEIQNPLVFVHRLISGEHMIKTAIFPDYDDNMLYRRRGVVVFSARESLRVGVNRGRHLTGRRRDYASRQSSHGDASQQFSSNSCAPQSRCFHGAPQVSW